MKEMDLLPLGTNNSNFLAAPRMVLVVKTPSLKICYLCAQMHPLRTYRIETERLVIRCYKLEDAPAFLESIATSKEHLLPYMAWAESQPTSLEERIDFLRIAIANYHLGKDAMMAIWDKTETIFIGSTGYHDRVKGNATEIGCWIDARQAGKGYATEAVAALTKVAFEIEGWDRVEIHHVPENEVSAKVPFKLGYTYEATLKLRLPMQGGPGDEMIWSIFRQEFEKLPIKKLPVKAFDAIGREISLGNHHWLTEKGKDNR
jgi:RimJ/RimL family protein N-acetyltransferase